MDVIKYGMKAKVALSANMERFRKSKGLSQGQLAEKIGLTQKSLSEIETGKRWPSYDNLEKIAAVLEVEETDLLSDAEMVSAFKYLIKNNIK